MARERWGWRCRGATPAAASSSSRTRPQPHLDGRYTTFGEIVSGLDVATSLVEGDVILEVTVE